MDRSRSFGCEKFFRVFIFFVSLIFFYQRSRFRSHFKTFLNKLFRILISVEFLERICELFKFRFSAINRYRVDFFEFRNNSVISFIEFILFNPVDITLHFGFNGVVPESDYFFIVSAFCKAFFVCSEFFSCPEFLFDKKFGKICFGVFRVDIKYSFAII